MAWAAACVVALLACAAASAAPVDPRVTQLLKLEAASRNGLIRFDEALFDELALSPDRPYHLIFFGSAKRFMDSPKVQLAKLKKEFTYMAKAFKSGPDAGRVFFADMWFDDASAVFDRLGLSALPAVFHWGPAQAGKPGKRVRLPAGAKVGEGLATYPWPAEAMAEFFKGRTGLSHAAIDRPSFLKSPLFPLFALAALAAGGAAAWRLYNSPIVRITWLWALGALAVYGFATAGGMYNIIRGMPMVMPTRDGKVKWWLESRQGQLGAEGFLMGSSYIVFSACISLMVYALPHIKDARLRGGLSVLATVVAGLVGRGIFAAYTMKSGMRMRSFFF